ncbi:MAG: NADPH-dependent 7-cyano-7-deazaguanine reductase QueF [Planctomycetota bacterium]|nr:MAG: NADPH-dependent 7-cyano-7-deazaguanine reductase QueF [Planctomycetota bacterium]
MSTKPSRDLEYFDNPHPDTSYEVRFDCPEFTCVCPMTGQPDFARIKIRYVPDQRCVELKSLKLYLWSFRDEGAFHEDVTGRIAKDLIGGLSPRFFEIEAEFYVRGGIGTTVRVQQGEEPW